MSENKHFGNPPNRHLAKMQESQLCSGATRKSWVITNIIIIHCLETENVCKKKIVAIHLMVVVDFTPPK